MFESIELYEAVVFVTLTFSLLFILSCVYRGLKIKIYDEHFVLITGCDTGFGYKTAKKLDDMGFHVFAACLTKVKMEELSSVCSPRLTTVHLDVSDDLSVAKALVTVEANLPQGKGLWAVVNNSGIVGASGLTEWLTKEDYKATINVNFLGLVMVTKTFLPLVRKSQGRIINTASVVGRFAFPPAPYTMSKYCVEAFSDVLRREVSAHGVSVHTIEPGGYQTNITDYNLLMASMKKSFNQNSEEVKEFYGLDYVNKLAKLTSLVCFLVSCPRLYEVVDTYVHAITARYPKTRYCVGINGNFLFRPLWTVPTWMSDFVFGMSYPLPAKLK